MIPAEAIGHMLDREEVRQLVRELARRIAKGAAAASVTRLDPPKPSDFNWPLRTDIGRNFQVLRQCHTRARLLDANCKSLN
jgi:hypothetical protein